MNNITSIINEIIEDVKNEQPAKVSTSYKFGEVQIKFDGCNYSSYYVSSENHIETTVNILKMN